MSKMNYKIFLFAAIALLSLVAPISSAASPPPNPIINCNSLFARTGNQYLPVLATITGYGSIVNIALLIILMVFLVLGVAYAFGYAFHIDSLITFAKTELLEGFGNLIIIAVVGGGISFAIGAVYFFANFAALGSGGGITPSASSYGLYTTICANVQNNIILSGLSNWFGIFVNLYITNFFATGSPPAGGLTIHLMPNNFGVAFVPFQGLALVTTLLWDAQTTYFGAMFLGMFIIVLLFMVYFLFPLFFYAGIVLRSFPWTRPAGGSLIALFVAFYIIFPALIYPFSVTNPASDAHIGQGFCSNPQIPKSMHVLCSTQGFLSTSFGKYINLVTFNFGAIYYDDVYSFIEGIEFTGLNLVGLIIALLVSYELIEKIGNLLGSPSLQGSRALSRIL